MSKLLTAGIKFLCIFVVIFLPILLTKHLSKDIRHCITPLETVQNVDGWRLPIEDAIKATDNELQSVDARLKFSTLYNLFIINTTTFDIIMTDASGTQDTKSDIPASVKCNSNTGEKNLIKPGEQRVGGDLTLNEVSNKLNQYSTCNEFGAEEGELGMIWPAGSTLSMSYPKGGLCFQIKPTAMSSTFILLLSFGVIIGFLRLLKEGLTIIFNGKDYFFEKKKRRTFTPQGVGSMVGFMQKSEPLTMKNEIIEKIRCILKGPTISEPQVCCLFILLRKLLEGLPRSVRDQFQLLSFYCDWALHIKIDRSEQGAAILERVHQVVVDHMAKKDNSTMSADLSAILSFDALGIELNDFLRLYADNQRIEPTDWAGVIPILAEILSSCPVTISQKPNSRIKQFLERIRSKPIKDGSVVQEFAIIKLPSAVFPSCTMPATEIFSLMLTMTDTTKIIAPMIRLGR